MQYALVNRSLILLKDHDTIIKLETMMSETQKDVKEIKNKLMGNGREGLCDIVNQHKTYFKIIGAALVLLGTGVVSVIVKLFLP